MLLVFKKTGKEVKTAISKRLEQLQIRLDSRNAALDEFMQDSKKVRSYLVRGGQSYAGGHRPTTLFSSDEISSEERQEIAQLCARIFAIEQEIIRLKMISRHMDDDTVFDMSVEELAQYGFDMLETE
jgi:hypothetical protein